MLTQEDKEAQLKEEHVKKQVISSFPSRAEKISWDRKFDNMISLLAKLRPLEEQISELTAQKMPILDSVAELRNEMVNTCIHPYTHLVVKDDIVICKFCDKKFVGVL